MNNPAKNPPPEGKDAANNTAATGAREQPEAKHLYDRHDPIPVPEAVESDTDSVWALFEEADSGKVPKKRNNDKDGFSATEPAPLLPDFEAPTAYSPLPDDPGFDDTTRASPLHPDFDAPTQAAPLGQRRKPG
jgi:hypothetical protein